MRYALISDIHANWQAWRAVQIDIAAQQIDQVICLGDIVGYGPRPADVLESVHASVHHFIMGNHEAALLGFMDENLFNGAARDIIQWTRGQLNKKAMRVMREMPLSLKGENFRCAHGEFSEPGQFFYIVDPEDASPSWVTVPESLLFVGHTHRPGIFLLGASGTPRRVDYQDVMIEEGKRFLINIGSVGSPRDRDPRACYCIYDTAERSVFFRRVPFDVDAYRADLEKAGLPETSSYFLHYDAAAAAEPVREALGFSPPVKRSQGVVDAVEVRDIEILKTRVRTWRRLAGLFALLLAGLLALGVYALHIQTTRTQSTDRRLGDAIMPAAESTLPFEPADVSGGTEVGGWRLTLGNRFRQTARPGGPAEYGPVLRWTSEDGDRAIGLESSRLVLREGERFTVAAAFREGADFRGTVSVQVSILRTRDGQEEWMDNFLVKEPTMKRADGWFIAQKTETAPVGTRAAVIRLVGEFTGSVELADPQFYLR